MEGHVRKRGANSWGIVIDLGRGKDGRRRQLTRSVKGKKRDAQALLAKLLHERDTGIDVAPERQSFTQFLRRWLRDYAATTVAPKTLSGYTDIIEGHLIPALGSLALAKLRPQHLVEYYAHALAEGRLDGRGGLSARSVVHHHKLIHLTLRHAVQWQLLARNPADAVKPPTAASPDLVVLRPEQVPALIAAADATPYGPLIRVALMTGCRRGELLAVRWQDVDLDASVLRVERTCQWLPGQGFAFKEPKTPKSRRRVALSPETLTVLRSLRGRQLEVRLKLGAAYRGDLDLVFCTPIGAPLDFSNLRKAWLKIVRAADVRGLRFHDLRHACATLMLQRGVSAHVVAERLGHSAVSTTLNIYGHVLPDMQTDAAAALDGLMPAAAR